MKKRIISSLLVLLLLVCAIPCGQAFAKSKEYTTLKMPTEDYKDDNILPRIIMDLEYTTSESDGYTLINSKTEELETVKELISKDLYDYAKEITEAKHFTKISFSKDMKKINIVQKKKPTKQELKNIKDICMYSTYYQFLNGVDYDEIDCYVTIKNAKGKVLKKGYYQEVFK